MIRPSKQSIHSAIGKSLRYDQFVQTNLASRIRGGRESRSTSVYTWKQLVGIWPLIVHRYGVDVWFREALPSNRESKSLRGRRCASLVRNLSCLRLAVQRRALVRRSGNEISPWFDENAAALTKSNIGVSKYTHTRLYMNVFFHSNKTKNPIILEQKWRSTKHNRQSTPICDLMFLLNYSHIHHVFLFNCALNAGSIQLIVSIIGQNKCLHAATKNKSAPNMQRKPIWFTLID